MDPPERRRPARAAVDHPEADATAVARAVGEAVASFGALPVGHEGAYRPPTSSLVGELAPERISQAGGG